MCLVSRRSNAGTHYTHDLELRSPSADKILGGMVRSCHMVKVSNVKGIAAMHAVSRSPTTFLSSFMVQPGRVP